jgi:uncharacterized protein
VTDELEFEWDPDKAAEVEREHGITFDEALTIFLDPLAATMYDEAHSQHEERYVTIGTTHQEKVVVVAHTDRGSRIRLINARLATRPEKQAYEQGERPRS